MALEGHVFLLKGKFTIPRKDLIHQILDQGGEVVKTFNKTVTHLLVGEEAETEVTASQKIEEKGLPIVHESYLDEAHEEYKNSPRKLKKKDKELFSFNSPKKASKKALAVFDFTSDIEDSSDDDRPKKRKKGTRNSRSPRRSKKDSDDSEDEAPKKKRKAKKKLDFTDDQKTEILEDLSLIKVPDDVKGKGFFLSGKYKLTKEEVKDAIEKLGGSVMTSISGKVSYMLVHPDLPIPTSAKTAKDKNVTLLDGVVFVNELTKNRPQSASNEKSKKDKPSQAKDESKSKSKSKDESKSKSKKESKPVGPPRQPKIRM
eukprot:TRINITY_DN5400_c0_g1_i1.p1 TRINITY_DN5400_c0_g1~~TRINITY_DN5400_c0_g1_i1.p1  ORF type:complete len:323 (-),score=94.64 TRINITY_DN5400_c0_g1_i1:551-1495(-)